MHCFGSRSNDKLLTQPARGAGLRGMLPACERAVAVVPGAARDQLRDRGLPAGGKR